MHFFVLVPAKHSVLCVSVFQPSPDLTRKFLYQEFAFTNIMLAVALKAPVINMAFLCLMLHELMKIQPLPQIAYNVLAPHNSYSWSKQGLILFPGIDACKMNIIWRQWIILPRPPNMCLLLITLVCYSSMTQQNEWSGFRSLCIPAPFFPTHYGIM